MTAHGGSRVRAGLRSPFLWAFLAGVLLLTLMRPLLRFEPAPPPREWRLPEFELTASDGRPFGSRELEGQVWIAAFFFTRCVSICPLVMGAMARLDERLAREHVTDVGLVGITVDPEHDTPDRLREYASSRPLDARRMVLLTGSAPAIGSLLLEGFKVPLGAPERLAGSVVEIAHSGKLVLVDRQGWIRGFYGTDAEGIDEAYHRALHVRAERAP